MSGAESLAFAVSDGGGMEAGGERDESAANEGWLESNDVRHGGYRGAAIGSGPATGFLRRYSGMAGEVIP